MPNPVLTDAIDRVAGGDDLSAEEAAAVLRQIMAGEASEAQSAAFLIALRTKGETVDELVGLARTMREMAVAVNVPHDDLLDTAGTGGGRPTFNVSTTAAFVAAGAGCVVAKHGNRSATGRSGSADVLEALGARIDLEPAAVAECIDTVGFGFMFAPHHHLAMRHVIAVRKELAVRTIFNFLGPLTNPAGATRQVIGVSDARYLDTIAAALRGLGGSTALVVSSTDGLDEISVSAPTTVVELKGGEISGYEITPESLGIEPVPEDAVGAADPERSAEVARAVMSGARGPERSLTVANAAAAIYVGGKAGSLEDGVRAAEDAIDSGSARDAMERFVERTRALAAG
ncbi:MAG: anthranilate phosphoribosyltransferase [Thermoleophilaceae bacterium]|nr:anthranilate phosphoribosyltransferase [Thermoleophilaceae bacterium]